jgi:hypothetical protein
VELKRSKIMAIAEAQVATGVETKWEEKAYGEPAA